MTMILDNRSLEPPQPMMRTLAALEKLNDGETLIIINDRRPMFLYEQLDELGYSYETNERDDGSFEITITKG
jgi:tRNA 2-thiouridine synthesizing protein A